MNEDFKNFWTGLEKEGFLGLGIEKIKKIADLILLKEFGLRLVSVVENERKDLVATCSDRLGKDAAALIRVEPEVTGIEKDDVEDFYSDAVEIGAVCGIYMTGSFFTKDAQKFSENLPVRLIDRKQLNDILYEMEATRAEKAFVSDISDEYVSRHFRRKLKRKLTNVILKIPDKLEEIDRRYLPFGFFTLKSKGAVEERGYAYMDLSSGDVYYIDEGELKITETLKHILELPADAKNQLIELITHGDMPHDQVSEKAYMLLHRKSLAASYDRRRPKTLTGQVASELSATLGTVGSQIAEFGNIKQQTQYGAGQLGSSKLVPPKSYIGSAARIPVFDQPFNLENFIEASTKTEGFDSDAVKYKPEEIEDLLKKITGLEVRYNYTIYFPYYLARYIGPQGIKYERLWSPRFKPFFPKKSNYGALYHIIDKFPDFPYLVAAFFYINSGIASTQQLFHIFAATVIFAAVTIASGITLKGVFRTQRTTPFYATHDYGIKFFRYGFPSMHSLVSFGAITFTYFIDPGGFLLSLLCIPVAIFFMYSRIRIGAHNKKDVIGGAVIGLFLGLVLGYYLLPVHRIPEFFEVILSVFMVAALVISIIGRIKYMH